MANGIYDVFALALVFSGVFGGVYILRRAFYFWKRDRFLSVLDFAWSIALLYMAVYYFAIIIGFVVSEGAYIRPVLIPLVNIPVIITIARR